MKIIGITGPTGAGKTTVLNALADLGGAIIDCDAVYHDLLRENKEMLGKLRDRFGDDVFCPDGSLDRKALGAIVFKDPVALKELNGITHRYVGIEVGRLLAKAEEEKRVATAVDAIGLLEGGLKDKCDLLLAVTAPPEIRVERIMAREGISREYAESRVNAQKPNSYFEERCHRTFNNNFSSAEEARASARNLFEKMLKEGSEQ
jgi:dephospho-CoA kinase